MANHHESRSSGLITRYFLMLVELDAWVSPGLVQFEGGLLK